MHDLLRLVVVYRGVMLYGDSGSGKSSLINAALLDAAKRKGLQPERVRVQPTADQELVVERIAADVAGTTLLPSIFATDDGSARHVVLSSSAFLERLKVACASAKPLLVFDQFEELVTMFDNSGRRQLQQRIVDLLVALQRDEAMPVKVLLVFREDYLARIKQLLEPLPELVDQALRLTPPRAEELPSIIRGPFERFEFGREISPELAERLREKLQDRFGSGEVSLSEVQTVCLRLWRSPEPEALLEERGIKGLLEDYLGEELDQFPPELRYAAVALLSQMVTSQGTRSVVSADDLIGRVLEEEKIPRDKLEVALQRLERDSKLVRGEQRRDLYLYEITSEFLVPWISERREASVNLRKSRQRRKKKVLIGSFAGFAFLVLVLGSLVVFALRQRSDARDAERHAKLSALAAQRAETQASSLALAFSSRAQLAGRLDASLLLGLAGLRLSDRPETRSSMVAALEAARSSPAVAILRGGQPSVQDIALAPDGRVLASAGSDGTIVLWDVGKRERLGRPLRASAPATSVAFSPDGRMLASGATDGRVQLWDAAGHEPLGDPLAAGGSVRSVAFSADGKTVAAGLEKGSVRLWDTRSRKATGVFSTGYAVRHIVFDRAGRFVVVATASACEPAPFTRAADIAGFVAIWNARTHKVVRRLTVAGGACGMALSRDGKTIAAGGQTGAVRLWRLPTGAALGSLPRHRGIVHSLAFSPDARVLASAGTDRQAIRRWNVRERREVGQPLVGQTGVNAVVFTRGRHGLASAGGEGTVRLWDTRAALLGAPLRGNRDSIESIAFTPRGGTAISASEDGTVRVWDMSAGKQVGRSLRHEGSVVDVAVTSDGRLAATGGGDHAVRFWDLKTLKPVGRLEAPDDVWAVAFSPNGRIAAWGGVDNKVHLSDVRTRKPIGSPLRGHSDAVRDLAFSPDGRMLASASFDGTVRLWDVGTRKLLGVLRIGGYIFGVAFSPDGRTLASADGDGTVRLWSVRSRRQIGEPLLGHTGFVYSVSFRPDGRMLASAGLDGTVRLWDLRAAKPKPLGQLLRANSKAVYAVAFNPTGDALLSGGADHMVHVWDGILWNGPTDLRDRICRLVVGDLTHAEWAEFAPEIHRHPTCG